MTIPIPIKVHGETVVRYHFTPKAPATRSGYVILIQRSGDHLHPYVTGWIGLDDDEKVLDREWCYGHYLKDEDDALEDYAARCRRGY